ncbi:hypothetical protein PT2222_110184 [Paraburkholderia tropica]
MTGSLRALARLSTRRLSLCKDLRGHHLHTSLEYVTQSHEKQLPRAYAHVFTHCRTLKISLASSRSFYFPI